MERTTVFTKTAKGITQVNQKSASLSKDLMKVLKLIDGKSNFGQLMDKAALDKPSLEKALSTLTKDGFARVFQVRKEEADPFAGEEDDFDFTAPGKMPATTQRVIAGAANDISELVRQQERQDSDQKARTQAQEAARAKAKTEAESRAKLEAEARSRAEAEQQAMEQAKRAREASERAKAELESKMREEEARKRSLADQQAKLTTDQRAKEEQEQRRLGELRLKAEQEAKALAEARVRAEAEAQALAKARVEAEAAAKKQAAVATTAEQEMRARLKEEIESRIRGEMEQLLRNELEEKTRAEMQSTIFAEAKLAAKAELEERLRDEREGLAKAEMEARRQAETAARARADHEAKLRAEAEERAAAESQARIKAEEETRQLRIRAQRASEEAEVRAREQQDMSQRLEAERRGKIEAEARVKIEAEERERRERELQATLEEERKAKQEAEMRARIEARARETIAEDTRAKVQAEIEGDMTKRAEIEGKAQARAYMEAKARAERDEDDRLRNEQAKRAREIAQVLRTKVEPDAPAATPSARRRTKRRGSLVKPIFYSVAGLIIVTVIALHVVPLGFYTEKIQRSMSAWMHDDVSIASLTFRLVPTPHLRFENLKVGKGLDAKVATGRIYPELGSLFSDRVSISEVDFEGVSVSGDAVRRIPTWGSREGKAASADIRLVVLRGVKLEVKPAIDTFDGTLNFTRDGRLADARLNGPGNRWTLAMKPQAEGTDMTFTARDWTLPVGVAIPVSDVTMKGTLRNNEIVVPEFEASALGGKVNGTLRVTWSGGPVKLDSDLALAKVNARDLIGSFTKDIAVTGKLDGNFSVSAEAPTVDQLMAAPRAQGKFRLTEGSISNVDLVAVMQSESAGQRAGVTKFAELTGEYGATDQRSAFRQVSLLGGVLRGNGALDIGANSSISGRVQLEIRSQVAQDRGAFNVSGTISRPVIRRGG
jgi:hypothetical protein